MVKYAHVIRSFKIKDFLYVIVVAISCLCIFSIKAQIFQPPETAPVFPTQEETLQAGSEVYPPFSPFHLPQPLGNPNKPVLFGPGGEPIGGLPATNGAHLLFLGVIVYSFYRLITQRKKR